MSTPSESKNKAPAAHFEVPAPSAGALAALEAQLADVWPAAQAEWSRFLLMGEATIVSDIASVAQIHLGTRQVSVHGPLLIHLQLEGSLHAILAHEIGHHVRYPGTLAKWARMQILEKSIAPLEDSSFVNLFTDLLINEELGRRYSDELANVYRAFHRLQVEETRDPVFLFYLAVYEELWQLPPGDLMGPGWQTFANNNPGYRADAQLLSETLFGLGPNIFTQFIYFVSMCLRYAPLPDEEQMKLRLKMRSPYRCLYGDPSAEDWADALVPNAQERQAVHRAVKEGWLEAEQAERMTGADEMWRRIQSLPGQQTTDTSRVPDIMAAYYRAQAERYLVKPPKVPTLGEPIVPTSVEPWDFGDPVKAIDWHTTFSKFGPVLGAVQPLKRTQIVEIEGYEAPFWQPRMEIYLDVSGSMPDPRASHNAMTLAAQILTLGTVRAGGWVRALLYSTESVSYWEWCRSDTEISRFLMHYLGGGTRFPFHILEASVAACGDHQPIRAIISDHDFHHNYHESPTHGRIFAEACERSAETVLLLHGVTPESQAFYRGCGAQVVGVEFMDDFPKMAVDLAAALFANVDGQGM